MGSGSTIFEDDKADNHKNYVTVPCIIFFIITPMFLGIRLWNRIHRKTGIGLDDATIVLSFICTLIVQIFMMLSVDQGFGDHVVAIPKPNLREALKLFYLAQIFYKLTINLTKISILLLYLRIFVQKWFRICCKILIAIVFMYMIATTASSIWQCTPIAAAWDKRIQNAFCISLPKNWYANAGFAISTDLIILCLPMQPIWTSKLPIHQKRALMLVFALGLFVTASSIMRMSTLNFSITSPDMTYAIASTLWTMIEENVAIICACLPMCRMVLGWMFPNMFGISPANTDKNESNDTDPTITIGQRRTRDVGGHWQPYTGPPKSEGFNQSIVQHPEETSKEHILSYPSSPREFHDGAIRKTTQYEVSYEMQSKNSCSTIGNADYAV